MKIGDYVRTEDGIKKVLKYAYNDKYENSHCVWFDNKDYGILFTDEEVNKMKPSPNIIDLIEVGDYVNGNRVDFTNSNNRLSYEDKCIGFYDRDGDITLFEKDIKSIVTKEQFESMNYEVN